MDSGQHAARQRPGILGSFLGLLVKVAVVFGLAWFLGTFIFQPYEIPSGSMEDTIMTGDMVFSEKVTYYFREPEPGDIVTFQDPEIPGRILIKRCIATAGQTVNITDEDGLVYVDGVAQSEPYTSDKPSYTLESEVGFPYTVPEGSIWVMGDNRTNSQDSRFFGAIPMSSVESRGVFVYWPFNNMSLL